MQGSQRNALSCTRRALLDETWNATHFFIASYSGAVPYKGPGEKDVADWLAPCSVVTSISIIDEWLFLFFEFRG